MTISQLFFLAVFGVAYGSAPSDYVEKCESCHGPFGLGDGPEAKELTMPSFADEAFWVDRKNGQTKKAIKLGSIAVSEVDTMPAFKDELSTTQIADMDLFIRLFPTIRAAGDPAAGKAIFLDKCAPCHGESGVGDGPLAAKLKSKVGNLIEPPLRDRLTEPEIVDRVRHGSPQHGAMPEHIRELTLQQIYDLVLYLGSR